MLVIKILFPILFYSLSVSFFLMILPSCSALAVTGISSFFASPVLYACYRKDQKKRGVHHEISLKLKKDILWILLLSFSSAVAFNNLLSFPVLHRLFPAYESTVSKELYLPPLYQQLLCTVILIPCAEELCFRAHIFAPLREYYPFWSAALFSALAFGAYHGNVLQAIYAFLLGLLIAWIYEQYNTFWAAFLFHAGANLLAVLFTHWKILEPGKTPSSLILAAMACSLFLMAVCIRFIKRSSS